MGEPRVSGMSVLNRNRFLVETRTPGDLEKVMALLPPDDAKLLRMPVATEWYPLSKLSAIDRAIVQVCFGGDRTRAREMGRFNLEKSLTRVYRFLFKLLEPNTVLKRGPELWKKLVDSGALEVYETGPRHAKLRVTQFDPMDEIYCEVLCGSYEGSIRACGEKNVTVEHPKCVRRGDPHMEFVIRW